MTTTPKAGLCQGPVEPMSQGIQSFQRSAARHPSAALSPTTPLQELSTPGGGRISWPQECAMQMHISSVFIQHTICPPRISFFFFFREAAAQGSNNNNNRIAAIVVLAANVLFSADYRPETSHKMIYFDCLSNPIR